MTKTTSFYFDERCLWHTTGEHVSTLPVGGWLQPMAAGGHPESPESKRRIKSLLDVSGMTAELATHSADPATMDDLLRVHAPAYLEKLSEMSASGGGLAGPGAPLGPGSFEIACLSAGLAKRAVDDVISGRFRNAFSLGRPPGHHCLPDQGMGFCLLANIAIAIEAAQANHAIEKIAVVDWDVHHGNGTQDIFYNRADVLTISLHEENRFPNNSGAATERGNGAGEGYNLNIPLLSGGGHQEYLYAMQHLVIPTLRKHNPDLLIVASGLDASIFDPLGRMQLNSESYREMTRLMMETADELCNGKLVVVHEGGYAQTYVPFCGLAITETLANHRTDVVDPFLPAATRESVNPRFAELQRQMIDEMASAL